jgi:hypothetical protein
VFRRIRNKRSAGHPDDQHLHTLIKIKIIRPHFLHLSQNQRNSLVGPLIWVVVAVLGIKAYVWSDHLLALVISFSLFVLAYHFTYRWLAEKKTPPRGAESGN